MTRFALTTAIALGFAAPALASDEFAAVAGVNAGDYTLAELVQLNHAIENDDRNFIRFATTGGSNVSGPSAATQAFARQHALQDESGFAFGFGSASGGEVISTQSFGASDAARDFAIEQARENNDWSLVRLLENGGSLGGARSLY